MPKTKKPLRQRIDLQFIPQKKGFSAIRSFPLQNTLQLSEQAKFIFDSVLKNGKALSQEEFTQYKRQFTKLDFFENQSLDRKRKTFFQEHIQKYKGIKLPSHYSDYKQPKPLRKRDFISQIDGMLIPHGHLMFTSKQINKAFSYFNANNWPDVFIIVATNHYSKENSILDQDIWINKSKVKNDWSFAYNLKIKLGKPMSLNSHWFLHEHSWSIFLPLLLEHAKNLKKKLRIVPILFSSQNKDLTIKLSKAIKELSIEQKRHTCFIASGDLTHFGHGYTAQKWIQTKNKKRSDVFKQVIKKELPILEALAQKQTNELEKFLPKSTFCANSQLIALNDFVSGPGKILDHKTIINFQKNPKSYLSKEWEPTDQLYSTASIIYSPGFNKGMPKGVKKPFSKPSCCIQ